MDGIQSLSVGQVLLIYVSVDILMITISIIAHIRSMYYFSTEKVISDTICLIGVFNIASLLVLARVVDTKEFQVPKYNLAVAIELDGNEIDSLQGIGTFDILIENGLKRSRVSYDAKVHNGTNYKISNVRLNSGYKLKTKDNLSGIIDSDDRVINLSVVSDNINSVESLQDLTKSHDGNEKAGGTSESKQSIVSDLNSESSNRIDTGTESQFSIDSDDDSEPSISINTLEDSESENKIDTKSMNGSKFDINTLSTSELETSIDAFEPSESEIMINPLNLSESEDLTDTHEDSVKSQYHIDTGVDSGTIWDSGVQHWIYLSESFGSIQSEDMSESRSEISAHRESESESSIETKEKSESGRGIKVDDASESSSSIETDDVSESSSSIETDDLSESTVSIISGESSEWYTDDIEELEILGIFDGDFETLNDTITNREAIDILNRSCEYTEADEIWFSGEEEELNRGQFISLLESVLGDYELNVVNDIQLLDIADYDEISNIDTVLEFYRAGIISGETGKMRFNQSGKMTKAMAYVMVFRMIKNLTI